MVGFDDVLELSGDVKCEQAVAEVLALYPPPGVQIEVQVVERVDVPGRVDGAEVVVAQLPATRVWPVHSLHDAPVDGDVSLLGACRHQGVCVLERLCCCDGRMPIVSVTQLVMRRPRT